MFQGVSEPKPPFALAFFELEEERKAYHQARRAQVQPEAKKQLSKAERRELQEAQRKAPRQRFFIVFHRVASFFPCSEVMNRRARGSKRLGEARSSACFPCFWLGCPFCKVKEQSSKKVGDEGELLAELKLQGLSEDQAVLAFSSILGLRNSYLSRF